MFTFSSISIFFKCFSLLNFRISKIMNNFLTFKTGNFQCHLGMRLFKIRLVKAEFAEPFTVQPHVSVGTDLLAVFRHELLD